MTKVIAVNHSFTVPDRISSEEATKNDIYYGEDFVNSLRRYLTANFLYKLVVCGILSSLSKSNYFSIEALEKAHMSLKVNLWCCKAKTRP